MNWVILSSLLAFIFFSASPLPRETKDQLAEQIALNLVILLAHTNLPVVSQLTNFLHSSNFIL